MFIPPVHFDKNEGLVLVTMIALPIVLFAVPKRLPTSAALTIMLYNVAFSLTTDSIVGSSFPWDFYDTMDTDQYDLFDLFIYIIQYPIYGYFFGWFYTYWVNKRKLLLFILVWALITTLLEWISVQFNVYRYKNSWNIYHSGVFYLLYFPLQALFVRWLLGTSRTSAQSVTK